MAPPDPVVQLPLHDMADRHPGLTPPLAESYLQAARVCLDRHHSSPTEFSIRDGESGMSAIAVWESADDRTRGAWANEIDTTEAGAYACALAAVEVSEGLVAIRRADNRTGADYYIAPPGQKLEDLEGCLRLEVSGTDTGTSATIMRRLREKLEQAGRGKSNLPAMAGVVGFEACLIVLERVEQQ